MKCIFEDFNTTAFVGRRVVFLKINCAGGET